MFILLCRALKLALLALCAAAPGLVRAEPVPIRVALIESLSGPFANTGEAVLRNLTWAVERVNAGGGVKLTGTRTAQPLLLERYDSKGQNEEALSALKAASDDGAQCIVQGTSSSVAAALIAATSVLYRALAALY